MSASSVELLRGTLARQASMRTPDVATQVHRRGAIAATNIYQRTAAGWRMVLHHASPVPEVPVRGEARPSVLH